MVSTLEFNWRDPWIESFWLQFLSSNSMHSSATYWEKTRLYICRLSWDVAVNNKKARVSNVDEIVIKTTCTSGSLVTKILHYCIWFSTFIFLESETEISIPSIWNNVQNNWIKQNPEEIFVNILFLAEIVCQIIIELRN